MEGRDTCSSFLTGGFKLISPLRAQDWGSHLPQSVIPVIVCGLNITISKLILSFLTFLEGEPQSFAWGSFIRNVPFLQKKAEVLNLFRVACFAFDFSWIGISPKLVYTWSLCKVPTSWVMSGACSFWSMCHILYRFAWFPPHSYWDAAICLPSQSFCIELERSCV